MKGELAQISRAIGYRDQEKCILCGHEQGPICPVCRTEYFHPELERCQGCGKLISPVKRFCGDCEAGKGPQQLDQVTAWGHYSGDLQKFIQRIKFKAQPREVWSIARPFADWALGRLPAADGLVPVPMHLARAAERGYNQAEVLSSALHWELGMPLFRGVERIKSTESQVHLSRQERLQNLKGAFVVRYPELLEGRSVWLVDDVTTTGATLEAVAEVLRASGVRSVFGLCLAAGLEKKLVPSGL